MEVKKISERIGERVKKFRNTVKWKMKKQQKLESGESREKKIDEDKTTFDMIGHNMMMKDD